MVSSMYKASKRPLVIIGKGASISRSEYLIRDFIETTQLPFLPTPMGKGVVPDDHPNNVSSARSTALENVRFVIKNYSYIHQADLIILLGARLNWILHFGLPPRFAKGVKVIQIDNCPEEFNNNITGLANLLGDLNLIVP